MYNRLKKHAIAYMWFQYCIVVPVDHFCHLVQRCESRYSAILKNNVVKPSDVDFAWIVYLQVITGRDVLEVAATVTLVISYETHTVVVAERERERERVCDCSNEVLMQYITVRP